MHRVTGLFLIALLLAAVFFLSLPGTTAWQRVLQDSGHGPVFAGIAIVLLLMRSPRAGSTARHPRDYSSAFCSAVALGIVSELIQHFQPNRNVSLFDVLHDAAGAALGLTLLVLFQRRRSVNAMERAGNAPEHAGSEHTASLLPTPSLIAIALASLLLLAWQPIKCATAYAERSRAFPTLLQATRAADAYFIRGRDAELERTVLPARWQHAGEGNALRLSFPQGTKPALDIEEPARDWRGYDSLLLDMTNPGERPLEFRLRIHDVHHDQTRADRFKMPVTIPPASRVTVKVSLAAVASAPARRPMDMAAIANVRLFSRAPLAGTEFYVSRLWLE